MSRLPRTLALLTVVAHGTWAAEPPPAAGDDWDWSGFTGLDDAPVMSEPRGSGWWTDKTFRGREEVENARPDMDAPPRAAYALFPDSVPFEVIPSQRDPDMHPCSNCHQWVESDPRPRALKKPHDNFELAHGLHGKGRFWCFTCHHLDGSGGLVTLEGEKLDFADAYLLCSQCHADQARDWAFGAHGKRISGWRDQRQVLNCTACHYQHRPALKGRLPEAGPVVRAGLPRPAHWTARQDRDGGGSDRDHGWKAEATTPDRRGGAAGADDGQAEAGERRDDGQS